MESVGSILHSTRIDSVASLEEALRSINKDVKDRLYNELWYACAGTNVNIPTTGQRVLYFPQGHLEQIEAYGNQHVTTDTTSYKLGRAEISCVVVNVELKVLKQMDEVFAQVTLLAETEQNKPILKALTFPSHPQRIPVRSFRKILAASDLSTNSQLSINSEQAEDFFPPQDMKEHLPKQDITAKDLHDVQWEFHHICCGKHRGQHLLSDWAQFRISKKVVDRDTFVLIRGENEQFGVGVQHSKRPSYRGPEPLISTHSSKLNVLSNVADAISGGTLFSAFYSPRIRTSAFVVPYDNYLKSVIPSPLIGMNFKWMSGGGDCTEESLLGTIIGIEPQDLVRWRFSNWKCLKVNWDVPSAPNRPERLSPWEMIPITVPDPRKRARTSATGLLNSDPSFTEWLPSPYTNSIQKSEITSDNQIKIQMNDRRPYQPEEMVGTSNGALFHKGKGPVQLLGRPECSQVSIPSTSKQNRTSTIKLFGVEIGNQQHPSHIMGSYSSSSVSISQKQFQRCAYTGRFIKVQKFGNTLEKSIDILKLNGYDGLRKELDTIFDFKGALVNGNSGPIVMYEDKESKMSRLGDLPWLDFLIVVKEILIVP